MGDDPTNNDVSLSNPDQGDTNNITTSGNATCSTPTGAVANHISTSGNANTDPTLTGAVAKHLITNYHTTPKQHRDGDAEDADEQDPNLTVEARINVFEVGNTGRVPTFDGLPSKQSFAEWIERFEDTMSLKEPAPSDAIKLRFIKAALEGAPRIFVQELPDDERNDFAIVIRKLKEQFDSKSRKYHARQSLQSCKQGAHEAIAEFSVRIYNLLKTATSFTIASNEFKEQLMEEFTSRLRPNIRYYVKMENPTSYQEAVIAAEKIELLLLEATADSILCPSAINNVEMPQHQQPYEESSWTSSRCSNMTPTTTTHIIKTTSTSTRSFKKPLRDRTPR